VGAEAVEAAVRAASTRFGVDRDAKRRCVVTLDSEKKNLRDYGHPAGHVISTTRSGPTTLDSVCRNVTELAKAAPKPPRRIRLQHGLTTVEVEWPTPEKAGNAPAPTGRVPAPEEPGPAAAREGPPSGQEQKDGLRYVCASMAGTFHHSPQPGAPPFVSVGDVVRPGQTIGILEVMKMMSLVEADTHGRIVEILATDAQSVARQERLIAIAPASRTEEEVTVHTA
jgi:acetyl-CoA carboxylase biotin carboxyl carrier protein